MVSQYYARNYLVIDMKLNCKQYNSSEIVETDQGYACTSCGLVLDEPKMEYHCQYKEIRLQHLLIEFRSKGLAFIIADQSPSSLFDCVVKMPSLKCIFRVGLQCASSFTNNLEEQDYIKSLRKTEHVIFEWNKWREIYAHDRRLLSYIFLFFLGLRFFSLNRDINYN